MFVSAAVLSSCNLDIDPTTVLKDKDAATLEHLDGVFVGLYSGMKVVTSGEYLYYADYHTDLFFETRSSGNRGGYFASWSLNSVDSNVASMWLGYYDMVKRVNYALDLLDRFEAKDTAGEYASEIKMYRAEAHFFRAYFMHQLVLRFCADYDPATAGNLPGVPYPKEFDPDAQLPRGTLEQTYENILEDIEAAAYLNAKPEEPGDADDTDDAGVLNVRFGAPDSFYVTGDALTAFKAQVALQMHDYTTASACASSLYATYPLVKSADELVSMWRDDISTETILRLEVNSSTNLSSVGAMADYYNGTWSSEDQTFICVPAYVPAKETVEAFAENDYRFGLYVSPGTVYFNNSNIEEGVLLTKFLGNRLFQTSEKVYLYRNMPKVFRVAEMYLVDAEAQYRLGGDALTPLNALRASRGLEAVSVSGDELFEEIKLERKRELIGEGHRQTDLKRWGDGFMVNPQYVYRYFVRSEVMVRQADATGFVWPIPEDEISNNRNITSADQNPGY